MWNPGDDKKTAGMMISAVVIVCLALIAVIFAFVMLQRRHESEISAASDTEGQTEITIEIGKAKKEEETAGEDGDEAEEDAEDSTGESESVYLVKGKDTGSNPYEKADHLAYTDSVRYTWEELSWLDSYGLCITRNEIYARHGRMLMIRIFRTILTGRIGMWRRHPPQISTNLSSMMWSCIMWN